jgi:hypothetical protein
LTGKKKAAFLKRMAAGRKKAARSNTGKKRATKKKKNTAAKPPKIRKLPNTGTGWMDATRVKIVKKRGRPAQVLIQRPRKR